MLLKAARQMLLKAAHSDRKCFTVSGNYNEQIVVDLHQKRDKNVRDVCA